MPSVQTYSYSCSKCFTKLEKAYFEQAIQTGHCPWCGALFNPRQVQKIRAHHRSLMWMALVFGVFLSIFGLMGILTRQPGPVFAGIFGGLLVYGSGQKLFGWGGSAKW